MVNTDANIILLKDTKDATNTSAIAKARKWGSQSWYSHQMANPQLIDGLLCWHVVETDRIS